MKSTEKIGEFNVARSVRRIRDVLTVLAVVSDAQLILLFMDMGRIRDYEETTRF